MKQLDVIRMTSTGEFGSLEDPNPVKRKQAAQIRKMRLQAHQQTQIKFSLTRALVHFFSNLTGSLNVMLAKKKTQTQCELNGHSVTRFGYYGCVAKCRFCGMQIVSAEELQSVR